MAGTEQLLFHQVRCFGSPVLAEEALGEGSTPGGKAVKRSRRKAQRGEKPYDLSLIHI